VIAAPRFDTGQPIPREGLAHPGAVDAETIVLEATGHQALDRYTIALAEEQRNGASASGDTSLT
jgi:hypothetical protein